MTKNTDLKNVRRTVLQEKFLQEERETKLEEKERRTKIIGIFDIQQKLTRIYTQALL